MSPLRPMHSGTAASELGERPRLLDHLRSEPWPGAKELAGPAYDGPTPTWLSRAEAVAARQDELILAALPRERFVACYHGPCGSLTRLLARRCHHLVACATGAPPSVTGEVARLSNVTLVHHALPHGFPTAPFDLVVLGQLDPIDERDATEFVRQVVTGLVAGGVLVTVSSDGTGRPQQAMHAQLAARDELQHQGHWEDPGFRLDLWLRH